MIQLTLGEPYPTPPQWIRASFTRPKILMSSAPAAVAPADSAATVAEKVDWCRNNFRYLRDPQQDIWFEKKFVLTRRLFGGGLRKLRAGDCEDFEGFLLEELNEAGVDIGAFRVMILENGQGGPAHMTGVIETTDGWILTDIWPDTYDKLRVGRYRPVAVNVPGSGEDWVTVTSISVPSGRP